MMTFMICMLTCAWLGYYLITRNYDDRDLGIWVFPILIGAIIGALIGLLFNVLLYNIFFKQEVQTKYDIVSIADNNDTYGHFVLGTGTVKENSYYYYYQKELSGGYTQHKVLTNQTTIFEDAIDYPYVILYRNISTRPEWAVNVCGCTPYTKAEIHVPKGTIIRQFKLDLE